MFWLWKGKCFSKVIFLPWIHRCIEGKLWKYDTAHRYAQRQRFPHQPSSTQKLICNWSNFSIGVQLKDIELTVLWTFLDPTWESCWNRLEQMAWLEFGNIEAVPLGLLNLLRIMTSKFTKPQPLRKCTLRIFGCIDWLLVPKEHGGCFINICWLSFVNNSC